MRALRGGIERDLARAPVKTRRQSVHVLWRTVFLEVLQQRCSVRSAPTRQTGAQLQDGRPHVHPIDGIMAGGGRDVTGERASSSSSPCCVSSRTHMRCHVRAGCRSCPVSAQLARSSSRGPHLCAPLAVRVLGDVAKLSRLIAANVGALRRRLPHLAPTTARDAAASPHGEAQRASLRTRHCRACSQSCTVRSECGSIAVGGVPDAC